MTTLNERDTENLAINLKMNFPIQESFGPTTTFQRELIHASADRLMQQYEEIERLRAELEELKGCNKYLQDCVTSSARRQRYTGQG